MIADIELAERGLFLRGVPGGPKSARDRVFDIFSQPLRSRYRAGRAAADRGGAP